MESIPQFENDTLLSWQGVRLIELGLGTELNINIGDEMHDIVNTSEVFTVTFLSDIFLSSCCGIHISVHYDWLGFLEWGVTLELRGRICGAPANAAGSRSKAR